jgi:hypothetical protein
MAKSVAEYNAEIKKLQDERNKVIADEKAEIIKGLKEQIGTYMIKPSELFSKAELGGTDAQPAVEVKERSERRTKEQIEADAKAKLEKKLVDAQAAFNAKTVVYRDGDKVFIEGQKGNRPSWMTDANKVTSVSQLN